MKKPAKIKKQYRKFNTRNARPQKIKFNWKLCMQWDQLKGKFV